MSIDIGTKNNGVNLSNGNFAWLLGVVLGFDVDDSCGVIDATELLARIALTTTAIQQQPSEFARSTVQDGNVIHCGVDAGYVARRIGELRTIAWDSIETGDRIFYG